MARRDPSVEEAERQLRMLLKIGGGSDALPMQQLATAPVLQTAALPNSSSGLPSAFEQLMLSGDRRPLPGVPGNGLNMPLPGVHYQPFGGAPAPLPTAPVVGTSPFAAGGTAMPYGLPHPAMAPAPVSRPPGLPPGLGFGSTPGRDPLVAPPPPLPGVAPLPDALIEQLLGGAPAGQRQRMPPLPTDQSRFFPSTPPPAPAPPAPAPAAPRRHIIEYDGYEDARVLVHRGSLYLLANHEDCHGRRRLCLLRLAGDAASGTLRQEAVWELSIDEGPDGPFALQDNEKNWVPFVQVRPRPLMTSDGPLCVCLSVSP